MPTIPTLCRSLRRVLLAVLCPNCCTREGTFGGCGRYGDRIEAPGVEDPIVVKPQKSCSAWRNLQSGLFAHLCTQPLADVGDSFLMIPSCVIFMPTVSTASGKGPSLPKRSQSGGLHGMPAEEFRGTCRGESGCFSRISWSLSRFRQANRKP